MTLDAAGWRRRGNELAKAGTRNDYQESLKCYSNGLELVQSVQNSKESQLRARLFSCRAHVRLLLGGDEEASAAVSDCRSSLEDDPRDPKTYWRAAKASLRLKLRAQALHFCHSGIENGGSAELRTLLAELGCTDEDEDEEIACTHSFEFRDTGLSDFRADALATFRAAVEADPTDADAHCNLGVALAQQGDEAGALRAFAAAVSADPKHAGAHRNLAETQREGGNFAAAERSYREVLRLAPGEAGADVLFGLGVSLGQRGDQIGAIEAFRAARAAEPGHADACLGLGIACEASGDAEGALRAFRDAAAAAPRSAAAQHNLGLALERLAQGSGADSSQHLFDAEVALHTACALDPSSADSQCQLGVVLLRAGKLPDAKAAFEEALNLDAGHLGAQANADALRGLCDSMCSAALDGFEQCTADSPTLTMPENRGCPREAWAEGDDKEAVADSHTSALNADSDVEL